MSGRVVCISGEDGAGGQEVAQRVASELGFRVIDEDIVTRAALEAGVDTHVMADVERRRSTLEKLLEGLGSTGFGAGYVVAAPQLLESRPSDELRGLIRSVIEEIATEGGAVIVAHAASAALGGREDVVRVLVTASPDTREGRLMEELKVDRKEAQRILRRADTARADYLKRFYDIPAEQPTHYDLVVNTDKVDPALAAALIVKACGDQSKAGAKVEAPPA
jgi:cytidylate kinase